MTLNGTSFHNNYYNKTLHSNDQANLTPNKIQANQQNNISNGFRENTSNGNINYPQNLDKSHTMGYKEKTGYTNYYNSNMI